MIDVVLFLMAMAGGGGTSTGTAVVPPATADSPLDKPLITREAEDQTPSGRFLTATETRPILTATRGNWVAVREYEGQDLVYFTHLLSWRCGLYEINYAINGGPMQAWPMPDCHVDGPSPNAITAADGLPYIAFGLGTVQQIDVEILYDDLGADGASFDRAAVLMP